MSDDPGSSPIQTHTGGNLNDRRNSPRSNRRAAKLRFAESHVTATAFLRG